MSWIQNLSPKYIQDLVPYASAGRNKATGDVWLNANESPFSRSDLGANRYPEFQPQSLLDAYAEYAGCTSDQLLVTRGIDEGIDLLLRAFCEPGQDQIIYTPPTYGMYSISATALGVSALAVPLKADFQLDIEALESTLQSDVEVPSLGDARLPEAERSEETRRTEPGQIEASPKLIFLCSPNNPTGNLLEREAVLQVLEAAAGKALVILDEAYIEFYPEASFINELEQYTNLVVARTLSKAFGLAGLRCGFLVANPELISILRKVSAPYPIPVPVVDLAVKALSPTGVDQMKQDVATLQDNRVELEAGLSEFSFVKQIHPGTANFLLLELTDVGGVMSYLKERGIIIRNQSHQVGLENCIRISIGTEGEQKTLLSALKTYEEAQ